MDFEHEKIGQTRELTDNTRKLKFQSVLTNLFSNNHLSGHDLRGVNEPIWARLNRTFN
jgi:hypothetical protein